MHHHSGFCYNGAAMKTFTVNSAAELLERDRRKIGRALRGIPAEHKDEQGRERWRLPVILDALSASGRGDGASTAAIDEILRASEAVDELLNQLGAADSVEAARALFSAEGGRIGALDRALERSLIGLRPAEAGLLDTVRNQVIGAAIGEALGLCNWQLPAQ
jgi:hypothetical protein